MSREVQEVPTGEAYNLYDTKSGEFAIHNDATERHIDTIEYEVEHVELQGGVGELETETEKELEPPSEFKRKRAA